MNKTIIAFVDNILKFYNCYLFVFSNVSMMCYSFAFLELLLRLSLSRSALIGSSACCFIAIGVLFASKASRNDIRFNSTFMNSFYYLLICRFYSSRRDIIIRCG
uniref:NADH dehydrogenase subunit 4L n=1 Tax=Parascaris univalens TaxID=6257 RepID=A0A915BLK4_PARUN